MKFRTRSNENRKIDLNWDRINLYTSRYKPYTPFDIEIVKKQRRRSDPLRKYYFSAVIKPLMEFSGYEPDELLEVHKYLKARFFNIKPDKRGIYRKKDIPSVFGNKSEISVPKKKEFVDWVIRLAARSGLYINDPGE